MIATLEDAIAIYQLRINMIKMRGSQEMNINEIQNNYGRRLPISYIKLIEGIGDYTYFDFSKDPFEPNSSWFFLGCELLTREAIIEGAKSRPAWNRLASYAEIDRIYRKRNHAPSPDGPISLDRLENAFCIAEDNGDLLYIDPLDENSIWIYLHDSGELMKIAASFDEWLKLATQDNN